MYNFHHKNILILHFQDMVIDNILFDGDFYNQVLLKNDTSMEPQVSMKNFTRLTFLRDMLVIEDSLSVSFT